MTYDLVDHLYRQRQWSLKTFGPGERTRGVIEHIAKEMGEVLADPESVEEWIDIAILALDGAWRTGATPEQVVMTLEQKMAKNEARRWPDWRQFTQGEAILHIKETGE